MEPRYVDDAFDDRDLSIEGQGFIDPELCKYVFKAIGRTRGQFKNEAEIGKWRRIDVAFDKGGIPLVWIENRMELAKKYRWGFRMLAGSILNEASMREWMAKNKIYSDEPMRKEQNNAPIRKA